MSQNNSNSIVQLQRPSKLSSSSPFYVYEFDNVSFSGLKRCKIPNKRSAREVKLYPEYLHEGISYPPKKKGRQQFKGIGYPICREVVGSFGVHNCYLTRWIMGFPDLDADWLIFFPYWPLLNLENEYRKQSQEPEVHHSEPQGYLKEWDFYFRIWSFNRAKGGKTLSLPQIYIYPRILDTQIDDCNTTVRQYIKVPDEFLTVRDSTIYEYSQKPKPIKPLFASRYYDDLGNLFFLRIHHEDSWMYGKAKQIFHGCR